MNKLKNIIIEENKTTKDKIYKTTLDSGLKIYICKKDGYAKKVGMFGTEYGSIDNEFNDILTGNKVKVPDGIAHFLEHKLFEQEGGNALDLFAKIGVSANAYTSFDHTVYFFETSTKFEESMKQIFELVMKPYFTYENVQKEKGIIIQEIKMYEDDPASVVYYNTLKAMYKNHPLNIDIAGTKETVNKITKENLYTCYNTFYSPKNMFFIVIGDVDVLKTINDIEKLYTTYENKALSKKPIRYRSEEPESIFKNEIIEKLDVYMPYISLGFKMKQQNSSDNIKNKIIAEIINEISFSKLSCFYEEMYNDKIINEQIQIEYECGKDFAYILIIGLSKNIEKYKEKLFEYIEELKEKGVDKDLFETIKKQLVGKEIYNSENIMNVHRDIIESIIQDSRVFEKTEILAKLKIDDVNQFIKQNFEMSKMVISIVKEKTN